MNNRLNEYFAELENDKKSQAISPMIRQIQEAGKGFIAECSGCNVNLVFVELAIIVAGLAISSSQKGAAKTVIGGFKILLDRKLKEIEDSSQGNIP